MSVKEIKYNARREITSLILVDKQGNVRYSFGTKAPVAKPKPNPVDKEAELALQEIKEAKTSEDLADIFKRYVGFQSDKKFISTLTERRQQLGIFKSNEKNAQAV